MKSIDLSVGAVLKASWDSSLCRILALDSIEVLYDVWWEDSNGWGLRSNLDKAATFYRTSRTLMESSSLVRFEPLSQDELAVIRSDLPLRVCRLQSFSWVPRELTSHADVALELGRWGSEVGALDAIDAEAIVLKPSGKKGGLKKGVAIYAKGEQTFDGVELLRQANNLQLGTGSMNSDGVGLYRLGIESSLPSYYIGEYRDKAGLLR